MAVQDARTGEVLASSHPHAHLAIASLTKMMTVLLALERHKLSDLVTVARRAAIVGESTINLRPGERVNRQRSREGSADPVATTPRQHSRSRWRRTSPRSRA